MKVTAVAERSGKWWAVRIPEVEGAFTQARRLDQVPEMAAEAAAMLLDVDPGVVEVVVEADSEDWSDIDLDAEEVFTASGERFTNADAERLADEVEGFGVG